MSAARAPSAAPWSLVASAIVGALILGSAPAAEAAWGRLAVPPPPVAPPDQSWLRDSPEKPGARSRGKVAVFVFKGDDVYQPLRAAVVRVLRRRGLHVIVTLRPVETAAEYREMSQASSLGVYIDGQLEGEGARQRAVIRLYSGLTGQRMARVSFTGATPKIVGDVGRTFWTRVGPGILRACSAVSRPRRLEREPLRIDAGEP